MSRGRNRRSRKEDTHDGSPGQPARYPARFTHLPVAGKTLHAPVRAGMEDARAGAKPRLSHRDLRGRPRDPVSERQGQEALQQLREIMGKLKLTVNEEKTRICKVPEGEFDFLGYTFGRMYSARTGQARLGYRPSKKSI